MMSKTFFIEAILLNVYNVRFYGKLKNNYPLIITKYPPNICFSDVHVLFRKTFLKTEFLRVNIFEC